MKMVIVSHTPHYRTAAGVVGWGPTIREIDHLAEMIGEVVHVAPLHDEPAPESAIAYRSSRVRLRAVPAAGGTTLRDKLAILRHAPAYLRAISEEIRDADAVHVRCPSNISLMAILLLAVRREPRRRWIKYAGNWRPSERESLSYALQRGWLRRHLAGGVVTVNGEWEGEGPHVRSFLNPCLTDGEVEEGRAAAAAKEMAEPVRLLYVGRVEEEKGTGQALRILAGLGEAGVDARLDVVGDGPERARFEALAGTLGVTDRVSFRGWLGRPDLGPLFAAAHFLLLPTRASEGWPKVLSEAMAYGAVPITGTVSSIPQFLARFGTGRAIDAADHAGFVAAIREYVADPGLWREHSRRAVAAAADFSYRNFMNAVADVLEIDRPAA